MKSYEIKAYSLAWVFKKTLPANKRKNEISFSSNINWPQWQLDINLNLSITDTLWFDHWDILKVYSYSDTYPNWKLIYTWQVQDIVKEYWENIQSVNITCFWLWTLLNSLIFKSWANLVFTKTQDPAQTIKDIIDYFNSVYTFWWLSYTWSSITNYGSSTTINFNYTDCFTALKNSANITNYRWHIDETWIVYFKIKPVTPTHKLTVQKDIQSITIKEVSENIKNSVYVEYNIWTTWVIEDSTSISVYWKKQEKLTETQLWVWSAITFANNYLTQNKDKKIQTTMIINDSYLYNWQTIENIKPWDTITVLNHSISITNLQVVRVNYNGINTIVDLDYFLKLSQFF